MKVWLAKGAVMTLAFSTGLVAAQSILADFFPAPITPSGQGFYEPDKLLGWKLIPNKQKGRTPLVGKIVLDEKINSVGFRDTKHTYSKGQDVFRIVMLGDSFCDFLDLPLKQLFHSVLERKLNSELHQPIERINLGISGFGTAQEYLALKHYGLKYRPDLVILAFYLGNDVHDNSLEWQGRDMDVTHTTTPFFVLKDGTLEPKPPNPNPGEAPTNIESKAPLQRIKDFANKDFPDVVYRIRNVPLLAKFLLELGLIEAEPNLPRTLDPGTELYLEQYPPEVAEAWEVTKALILKLAEELEASKIGFLVVVIPLEFEFRVDELKKVLEYAEMRTLKIDPRKPEGILSKFLETNHINFLLLHPGFEKYNNETGKSLHFHRPGDNHWNADGHALAAQLIYQKLVDDKLVPLKR